MNCLKYTLQLIVLLLSGISIGQQVTSYELSACDVDSFVALTRTRLISKSVKNDTLTLQIGFTGNCCLNPKPEIHSSNDSLFLTIENVSDHHCTCDCCFEIELKVSTIEDSNFVLMWRGLELKRRSKYPKMPFEYETSPKNQLDSEGARIGYWTEVSIAGRKIEMYYGPSSSGKIRRLWYTVYNQKGELDYVGIRSSENDDVHILEANDYFRYFRK